MNKFKDRYLRKTDTNINTSILKGKGEYDVVIINFMCLLDWDK